MRIIWVLVIWGMFVGGLTFYMQQRDTAAMVQPAAIHLEKAAGRYILSLTTTFTAEPDPFALMVDGESPAALVVRLGAHTIISKTGGIIAGEPVRVELTDGLKVGANELFIQASPPLQTTNGAQAVRVQLYKDEQVLKEQTYWAAPGENIAQSFRFAIEAEQEQDGHDH